MLARGNPLRLSNALSGPRTCRAPFSSTSRQNIEKYGPNVGLPNRSAFVKIGTALDSPLQLYAIIRALEKRYGAIRDFTARTDTEVPTRYQNRIHVSFRNEEAFERLPPGRPETFIVDLPQPSHENGGPSLDDLKPLLVREDYEGTSETTNHRLPLGKFLNEGRREENQRNQKSRKATEVEVTVQRRFDRESYVSPLKGKDVVRAKALKQAQEFLEWGGFNKLEPIPFHDHLPRETNLFSKDVAPDFARRLAFRNYARSFNIKNPHEIYPDNEVPSAEVPPSEASMETTNTKEDDVWEPLPGTEHDAQDDAPMPSDLESEVNVGHLSNAPPYAVPTPESSLPPGRPPASSPEAGRLKQFMGW